MSGAPPSTPLRRLGVQSEQLDNLILWTNPKLSGVTLVASTIVFAIARFATINVVATGAYSLLVAVLGAFVYGNVASFFQFPPLPVPRLFKEGVSEAQVKAFAERSTGYLNRGLALTNRLATGREPMLSGLTVGALYLVARASSYLSILGLSYGTLVLLFTGPKVYEMNKDQIDGAIDHMRAQFTAFYDAYLHKWTQKIPRYAPPAAAPAESTSNDKKDE